MIPEAVFSVVVPLLTAAAGFFFGIRAEKAKSLLLLRSSAYVDCGRSLADLTIAATFGDNELDRSARGRYIDAKARLCSVFTSHDMKWKSGAIQAIIPLWTRT